MEYGKVELNSLSDDEKALLESNIKLTVLENQL